MRDLPAFGISCANVARDVHRIVNYYIMDMDVQLHSFLKDLSKPQLTVLSKIATTAQSKAGKPIFLQGESADRFFLIGQG